MPSYSALSPRAESESASKVIRGEGVEAPRVKSPLGNLTGVLPKRVHARKLRTKPLFSCWNHQPWRCSPVSDHPKCQTNLLISARPQRQTNAKPGWSSSSSSSSSIFIYTRWSLTGRGRSRELRAYVISDLLHEITFNNHRKYLGFS